MIINLRSPSRLVCALVAAFLTTHQLTEAARLGAIKTISISDATPLVVFNKPDATIESLIQETPADNTVPNLISLAALRLDATYAAWAQSSPSVPMARQFPDTIDTMTGEWNTDSVESFTGSPGIFASSLWNMYKLTNSATWLNRAMEASSVIAASPALNDPSMGQSIGVLAYPTLKLAYEAAIASTEHAESAQTFIDAALTAASTLSRMYVRIPGVIKVRPTSDIAAEAARAGVATISPFAVFSTVEGSAAATGLLEWASTLPGGKAAWHDIAVRNAKRIATDHIANDGTVQGALVYSSLSATSAPKPLSTPPSSGSKPEAAHASFNSASEAIEAAASFVQDVMETLNGHPSPHSSSASSSSSSTTTSSAGDAMDTWLSSIGGQVTSNGLRQALGTITMIEAARATTADDLELSSFFVKAAEASALSLLALTSPSSAAAFDSLSSAAAASALAQLSLLPSLSKDRSDEYSNAAKSILSKLYTVASGSSSLLSEQSSISNDKETLGAIASKWINNLLKPTTASEGPHSILLPAVGDEAEADNDLANINDDLEVVQSQSQGITEEDIATVSSEEVVAVVKSNEAAVSRSILPNGSMLGDQLLLQALTLLA